MTTKCQNKIAQNKIGQHKMSGENSNLLIDFSSPVVKETHKPLIPMPCIKGSLAISPSNDNPFDIVASQSESRLLQNDPFELVFRTAFQDVCEINIISPKDEMLSNLDSNISGEKPYQTCVTNSDKYLKKQCSPSPVNGIGQDNSIDGSEDNISKVSFGDCSSIKLDDSDYITENKHSQICLPAKINLETSRSENENKSQDLEDISSEEGLKAVIATRVNKCIERVLNNTGVIEKLYKTTDDLNESKTVSSYKVEQKHYRRSLSTSVIRKEFLQDYNNKSFVGGIFILKNDEQIAPPRRAIQSTTSSSANTSQSSGCLNKGFLDSKPTVSSDELFSPVVDNKSVNGDESVFLSNDEQVFNEANKLANTFSKIATSFNHCQSQDPESDDENDLMSCKPEFLYADSSEDEAELLCKDPSLNFISSTVSVGLSRSFTNDKNSKVDSDALSRFKNRSKDFVSEDLEKPSNLPKLLCKDPSLNFISSTITVGLSRSFTNNKNSKVDSKALSQFKNRSKDLEKPSNLPKDTALRRSHSWDPPIAKATPHPRLHIPVAVVNSDDSSGVKQLRVKKVSVEPIRRGPLKAVLPVQNMTRPLELRGGNVPNKEVSPEPIQQPKNLSIVTPLKKSKQIKEPIAASTPNKSHSASLLTAHVSPIPVAVNNQRLSLDSKNYSSIPMNSSMKRSNSTSGASSSQVREAIKNRNIKAFEKKKPGLQTKLGGPNPRALSDLTKTPLPKTIPTKTTNKLLSKLKKGIGMNSITKDKENRLPV